MEMEEDGEVDDMAEKVDEWPGVIRSVMMGMGVAGICGFDTVWINRNWMGKLRARGVYQKAKEPNGDASFGAGPLGHELCWQVLVRENKNVVE